MRESVALIVVVLGLTLAISPSAECRMNYFRLPEWATPEAIAEFQEKARNAPNVKFAPGPPIMENTGDLNSPSGKFEHDNTPVVCFPIDLQLRAGQRVNVWIGSSDFVPYLILIPGSACQHVENVRNAVIDEYGQSDGTVSVAQVVFTVPEAGHYKVLVNDMNDRDRRRPGGFQVAVWFMNPE